MSSEVSLPSIPSYNCYCVANPNDFIEVKFDTANQDTMKGLHAYMNTLMNNNDDLMRYHLRKVTAYWGY